MSIANEIQRLQQAKADIAEAIVAKGGEVSGTIDNYAQAIEALPSGGGGTVAVYEGEITVTTRAYRAFISHDLGVVPIAIELYSVDTPVAANNIINAMSYNFNPKVGASLYYNASLAETKGAGVHDTHVGFTDTQIIAYGGGATRYFIGTYKYKIYYPI